MKSDRGRVQTAILIYLIVCVALNVCVWGWFVVHRHAPMHRFPLGERTQRFSDLLLFSGKYQVARDPHLPNFGHLGGTLFPRNYPALAVTIYLFLLQVCAPYAVPVFVAVVLGAMATACTLLWRRVRQFRDYRWYIGLAIFATGLCGWGTEITIMRGNIEGLMWIPVCLGAALYAGRNYRGAAAAFGVAACIKPYPVLWFALMARQRKYRAVVFGFVTMAVVTLGSLLVIDRNPLHAYRKITDKSDFFKDYIVAFRPMEEMKGDHSLFQTMKTLARVIRNHGLQFAHSEFLWQRDDPLARKLYYAYLPLALLIGVVVLWKVWNKPLLNQVFALVCVTVVLPMVAGDYTLTLLLIPMGFFLIFLLQDVAEGRVKMSLGAMLWFLLPCAWLMGIEPLTLLHGVFKCVALLALMGASASIPLPSTLFGESGGSGVPVSPSGAYGR